MPLCSLSRLLVLLATQALGALLDSLEEVRQALAWNLEELNPTSNALVQSQLTLEGWSATHPNWLSTNVNLEDDCASTQHLTCVDDQAIDFGLCPDTICASETSAWLSDIPSPFYLKVPIEETIFSSCFTQSNVPLIIRNPLNGYAYDVKSHLEITGQVLLEGTKNGIEVLVEAWHADPYGRIIGKDKNLRTPLYRAHEAANSLPPSSKKEAGCRIALRTDSTGHFAFHTLVPANYGPPQHIEFRITGIGIKPLVTKLYLRSDPYLKDRQLTKKEQRMLTLTGDLINKTLAENLTIFVKPAQANANDFTGTWSDDQGLILIESNGVQLMASEYPTPREWGSRSFFHDGKYGLVSDLGYLGARGSLFQREASILDTIEWRDTVWRRVAADAGFQHFRITVNETLRTASGGLLRIDEITLTFRDFVVPPMIDSLAPKPLQCTTSTNSEECWKLFDGDAATSWQSATVGGWHGKLSQAQIIDLDLGAPRTITGITIQCSVIKHCPQFFTLEASSDGQRFERLAAHRVYNVADNAKIEYSGKGLELHFGRRHFKGRPTGTRCGSCDSSSHGFQCALDGPDKSCASGWCDSIGLCAQNRTACPAGLYYSLQLERCLPCTEGTYRSDASNDELCLPCEAGYSCSLGSTSPRQYPCDEGYLCPAGEPPKKAAAGYRIADSREAQVPCRQGHYCVDGVERMCHAGTHANDSALSSCWPCLGAGYYCPEGSVLPDLCPYGHYCSDSAKAPIKCPPGTVGHSRGLKHAYCNGMCPRGFYCPIGTQNPVLIPAGVFSSKPGAVTADGDGDCAEGYFCPEGSKNATAFKCGSTDFDANGQETAVYCPARSGAPVPVSNGFYATGGIDEATHTSQTLCEPGHVCIKGRKHTCLAGTFEASHGAWLDLVIQQQDVELPCTSSCPAGHYCHRAGQEAIPCPPGRYGNATGLTSSDCSGACPRGHYCPRGTILPVPCPAGRFGNTTGLTTEACSDVCLPVSSSNLPHVCALSQCEPGYYCPAGSTHSKPYQCPLGFYCPLGSSAPLPCPPESPSEYGRRMPLAVGLTQVEECRK